MAVVCTTSAHLSPPMPEHLARAIAARTELFGFVPAVGDYGRGGHQLTLHSTGDDAVVARLAGQWPDPSSPVPTRLRDGAILLTGDRVRLPTGQHCDVDGFEGDRVLVLLSGRTTSIPKPISDVSGTWTGPTS